MQTERERLREFRASVAALSDGGATIAAIAKQLKASKSAVQRAIQWNITNNPFDKPPETVTFARENSGSIVSTGFVPQTPAEAAEKANLDLARYDITGGEVSSYSVAVKNQLPDGTTEVVSVPHWKCRVNYRAKPFALDSMLDAILDDIRCAKPPALGRVKRITTQDKLLEIGTADLHLGKMSAFEDSSFSSQRDRCLEATEYFLSRAKNVERILLPIGNDLLHVDTDARTSTKGTPQDCIADPLVIFTEGRRLVEEQVSMCARVAPVDVIVVPGNHDRLSSWHLAHVIDARFHGSDRVRVRIEPQRYRVYYHYGRVLLGFVHGCKSDPKNKMLGQIMAEEQPQAWAESDWREWHLGHVHRELVQQEAGVRIRFWPSLSPTDSWHYDHGYINIPEAQAILWDRVSGYDSGFTYRPRGGHAA